MKHVFFGLGAIGSNLLMQMIHLDKEGEFYGIDYDSVEERNVPTQAYLNHHIGMAKTNAMMTIIGMKKNKFQYTPINKKIESINDVIVGIDFDYIDLVNNEDTILYDCFDNTESRQLLEGIDNCIHIGFSPKYTAEIIWGERYSAPNNIDPNENDICDMAIAVPFINYVVSVASMVIYKYIISDVKESYIIQKFGKLQKI